MMRDHESLVDPALRLVDDLPALSEAERASLELALDALGSEERDSAPAGMNQRIVSATAPHLRSATSVRIAPAVAATARSTWVLGRRLGAGLAMAAALAIAAMAGRSGPAVQARSVASVPTGIERDIETWLTLSESGTGDLAAQTSVLDKETAALRESLSRPTTASDLWSEEGAL